MLHEEELTKGTLVAFKFRDANNEAYSYKIGYGIVQEYDKLEEWVFVKMVHPLPNGWNYKKGDTLPLTIQKKNITAIFRKFDPLKDTLPESIY
ncbi:MAG: hypothetical protein AAB340_00730 [Patescibacteria group bacterium]